MFIAFRWTLFITYYCEIFVFCLFFHRQIKNWALKSMINYWFDAIFVCYQICSVCSASFLIWKMLPFTLSFKFKSTIATGIAPIRTKKAIVQESCTHFFFLFIHSMKFCSCMMSNDIYFFWLSETEKDWKLTASVGISVFFICIDCNSIEHTT